MNRADLPPSVQDVVSTAIEFGTITPKELCNRLNQPGVSYATLVQDIVGVAYSRRYNSVKDIEDHDELNRLAHVYWGEIDDIIKAMLWKNK